MKSPASVAGHPLHPILVAFPLGLWTFSLAGDAAFHLLHASYAWKETALFCTGGGLLGAVAAMAPGFIDYASISGGGRLKKIAVYHLALNLTSLAVFCASFWLRRGEAASGGASLLPVGLTFAGVVLIGLGGWYGGEMVYKLRMAVDEGERKAA